ncbi:hypothetical protein JM18_006953 [Phytophthora kernoviae]|uniref:peptidylprolyl isomerase n=2 Tax=Phytophthora kernoviae TaxID=325452 RepID=A0A8T0LT82_9STRA|nr:hypothetical protein G195_008631 [Phytophthora kernoviae 00238/432]KAG2519372.1 hypothetical protein JM16_007174 [Phytophthora kernoviae]KAG2520773.1 hypothetical protein JM18_006953 [Phytophthora kernoviae]
MVLMRRRDKRRGNEAEEIVVASDPSITANKGVRSLSGARTGRFAADMRVSAGGYGRADKTWGVDHPWHSTEEGDLFSSLCARDNMEEGGLMYEQPQEEPVKGLSRAQLKKRKAKLKKQGLSAKEAAVEALKEAEEAKIRHEEEHKEKELMELERKAEIKRKRQEKEQGKGEKELEAKKEKRRQEKQKKKEMKQQAVEQAQQLEEEQQAEVKTREVLAAAYEENCGREVTAKSGLVLQDKRIGQGKLPLTGEMLTVKYRGRLGQDGLVFSKGMLTTTYGTGSVIAGWEEGMGTMRPGGVRLLTIPSELGYGESGKGDKIPPNSTLHFEVELVRIGKRKRETITEDDVPLPSSFQRKRVKQKSSSSKAKDEEGEGEEKLSKSQKRRRNRNKNKSQANEVNGLSSSVVVIKNDDFGGQWTAAWSDFTAKMDVISAQEDVELELNVVISPGPGHPSEPQDFGLCADAIRYSTVPVLGVCLGHQGLAQVYGGQVVKAEEVMHGRTSRVFFEEGVAAELLFAHIPNGFQVVRYHSLVINPEKVPEELHVLARTEDGVVMAVHHRVKPQFGVQFHPEAVCSEFGYQIFQNFQDLTLQQSASKCLLHHEKHPDQDAFKSLEVDRKQRGMEEPGDEHADVPGCRVLVNCALSGVASLEFAEFVFGELFGDSKRSFWLDSSNHNVVAGSPDAAAQSRFSIMGDDSGPLSYCVEYDVRQTELRLRYRQIDSAEGDQVKIYPGQDILTHVREVMQAHQNHKVVTIGNSEEVELPFSFRGGFVGYFGYEVLGSEQEGKLNNAEDNEERAPDASFVFADRTLIFDHRENAIYSMSLSKSENEHANWDWHEAIENRLKQLAGAFSEASSLLSRTVGASSDAAEVIFRPSRSRAQYVADIEEIHRLIRAGETYEVCLTNHLRAEYALRDPLAFYRMLRRRNPAPFAGFYLSNPIDRFQAPGNRDKREGLSALADSYALCCSSPERFLRVGADGWMESKPIKGTRPRSRDPIEDADIAAELAVCEKDRAENMMVADLVRNDFGVVARVGTVHVPRLMGVETYTTVHQLVTTVRAQRRSDADVVDVLRATFPGGSMTGAPKKRTMHIIRELERAPRGVYSGALGFLSIDGSCDLNIIIRTAIVTPNTVTLGAGGAIVALSDSDEEYDEMLLKARALVATIGVYATGTDNDSGARVVVD